MTPPAAFLLAPGAFLPTPGSTLAMRAAQGTSPGAGGTEGATDRWTGMATDQGTATVSLAGLVEAVAGAVRAGPSAAVRTGEQGATRLGAGGTGTGTSGPTEDLGLVRTLRGLTSGDEVGARRRRRPTEAPTGRSVAAGENQGLQPNLAGPALL